MLNTLYIENIAVIEKCVIDFTEGFNVLTGETGAGKSIVIDSINAVLGMRTSKELIRTGASKASVSAEFSGISAQAQAALSDLGCLNEDEPSALVINREISLNGKNICRINCVPTTVAALREVGRYLVDIHGQHESYELLSGDKHREYIDDFANTGILLKQYREVFHRLKECKHRLDAVESDMNERDSRIDILKYQINEIELADMKPGEIEALKEERILCKNSEKITSAIAAAHSDISGDERYSVLSALSSAVHSLEEVSELMPELSKLAQRLDSAYYEIDDCLDSLSAQLESREQSELRLEEIEQRLEQLNKITRKYGADYDEVDAYLNKSREELSSLESIDQSMEELLERYNELANRALELAGEISDLRRQGSEEFILAVQNELAYLDMPNVRLVVNMEKTKLTENGMDKIEILISANPGETPKPVAKIASGGELSRIMLSIKNVLTDSDGAATMIFDEVDTGISGSASQKVGMKLKSVSQGRQVICVTHQAQIAALADTHFLIKKTVNNGQTYTNVTRLDFEQRKNELARIIGGLNITELSLRHAEEMLNQD